MKGIKHPHIVQLYDIQKTSKFIYLIMEYCGGGDLAQLLRRKRVLGEAMVKQYIRQIGKQQHELLLMPFSVCSGGSTSKQHGSSGFETTKFVVKSYQPTGRRHSE